MSMSREWGLHFHETMRDVEENKQLDSIDLGDVWDGEIGEKMVYMQNGPLYSVKNIEYKTNNDKVEIVGPPHLDAGEVASLMVRWVPGLDSFGLNEELVVRGVIIYRIE